MEKHKQKWLGWMNTLRKKLAKHEKHKQKWLGWMKTQRNKLAKHQKKTSKSGFDG